MTCSKFTVDLCSRRLVIVMPRGKANQPRIHPGPVPQLSRVLCPECVIYSCGQRSFIMFRHGNAVDMERQ
jgi:hypothetical protein